jgi:hypothetical protein
MRARESISAPFRSISAIVTAPVESVRKISWTLKKHVVSTTAGLYRHIDQDDSHG